MNVSLFTTNLVENVSHAGFFETGAAQAERGKKCMNEYMTDRAKTATKPGAKKTSEIVLGYMVKRLSAHGGCLGSKRR